MKTLLFAISILIPFQLLAQNPEWIYFSKCSSINFITGDHNNIWVSTWSGVVKLDKETGIKSNFDKSNSPLPDNWITDIAINSNGKAWFSTFDKGLAAFDGVNWSLFDTTNSPLPGQNGLAIEIDGDDNLWILTPFQEGRLIRFDGNNWTLFNTGNSGMPDLVMNSLYADGNTLWMASTNNLIKFDGSLWTVFNSSNSNISTQNIRVIRKDHLGNIWLLHSDGVEKFDGSVFTLFDRSNTNIQNFMNYSMTIDTNNIIWTGAHGYNFQPHTYGGLLSFDGSSWTKYDLNNSPIVDDNISGVFADEDNNIWMGESGPGYLLKKEISAWPVYDLSNSGLPNAYIEQIYNTGANHAVIATQQNYVTGEGLVKYNWNSWIQLAGYYWDDSHTIATDHADKVYVKNRTALDVFDGTNWSAIPGNPLFNLPFMAPTEIDQLVADKNCNLWMDYISDYTYDMFTQEYTVTEGLAHYDGNNWTTYNEENSPLGGADILTLRVDNDNNIWIGSENGLHKFNGVDWVTYTSTNSALPPVYLKNFSVDSTGNIWVSNTQFGLFKFDGNQSTEYIHPSLGAYISGNGFIAVDIDGSIWQHTLFHVIRFDGSDWTTLSSDNTPMPYTNVNALSIDKYGNKWIGTRNGLLVYRMNGVIITNAISELLKDDQVVVYPNPANEYLMFDFGTTPENLRIYNIGGSLIQEMSVSDDVIRLNTLNLKPGIYIYKAEANGKTVQGKFVVK